MTITQPNRAYSTVASSTALLASSGIRDDWSSCQRQPVSPRACADPAEWADRLFHNPPPWVASVLAVRDRAVALVGIRTTSQESFEVLATNEHEVLVGSDERHLNFRASVRCTDGTVDVVTFVQVHNLLGGCICVPCVSCTR